MAADTGPHPAALCARTVTDQLGLESTLKYAISVVPEIVCVSVPAVSLAVMVTRYWSTGLLPGLAASQMATSVLGPGSAFGFAQFAETPVGADGGIVAGTVVTLIGIEAGLDPPMVVLTTVI